ncbi:MAG: glycosyltransferase [Kiritimatiellae bacterium]|nr:glycosyltransferase [Kiritimatiellia bacterium]
MKTILLATDVKFWSARRGSASRIACTGRYLREHGFNVPVFFAGRLEAGDVTLLSQRYADLEIVAAQTAQDPGDSPPPGPGKDAREAASEAGRSGPARARGRRARWTARLKRVSTRSADNAGAAPVPPPPTLASFRSAAYKASFDRLCAAIRPDSIMVEYVRLAYLIEGLHAVLPALPLTVIDTMDVMHARCREFRAFGHPHWVDITEETERQTLARFDTVVAIQEHEAAVFRRMLPGKRVVTVGHATDVTHHEWRVRSPVTLTYIGSNSLANTDAVTFFLESVWDDLRAPFGAGLRLRLVGDVCDALPASARREQVTMLGTVDDLASVYADTDIVVNPVRFGGGLKIKNVEALCHGKPLLTTSAGAQGLEQGAGSAFLVGDTAESQRAALAALITAPARRRELGDRALSFAREAFAPARVYGELCELLSRENACSSV